MREADEAVTQYEKHLEELYTRLEHKARKAQADATHGTDTLAINRI